MAAHASVWRSSDIFCTLLISCSAAAASAEAALASVPPARFGVREACACSPEKEKEAAFAIDVLFSCAPLLNSVSSSDR